MNATHNAPVKLTDPLPIIGAVSAWLTASDVMTGLTIIFTIFKLWEVVEARIEKRRNNRKWKGGESV
jgi:hypothetical protein